MNENDCQGCLFSCQEFALSVEAVERAGGRTSGGEKKVVAGKVRLDKAERGVSDSKLGRI